jgi:hypothetical protein
MGSGYRVQGFKCRDTHVGYCIQDLDLRGSGLRVAV